MGSELATGFDCSVCGLHHDVLPLSYSAQAPMSVLRVPQEEIEQRVVFNADQCVIDGRDFYLRGRIPVPVIGLEEPFIWGVWVEVGPKDFMRTNENWSVEGREQEAPFKGYLDTELFIFGNVIDLEMMVQTQVVGRRPHLFVIDPEHPIARDQREGMTMERVIEIAEMILHRGE